MIYIISDTHFNHKNIIDYSHRPFNSVEDMNAQMINNWNKVVSNKDTIYHLGDFSWGNKEFVSSIVSKLNGEKILIKGNHDKHSAKWYRECGFDTVVNGGIILDEFYLLSHRPMFMTDDMPYVNLHGHIHQNNMEGNKYFNVSVEQTNYEPIALDKIKKFYD